MHKPRLSAKKVSSAGAVLGVGALVVACAATLTADVIDTKDRQLEKPVEYAVKLVEEGKQIFRYDSFNSEVFWGDTLKLHQAIAGEMNGGVGPGVSPETALALGLKVDVEALPEEIQTALAAGQVDLSDPSITLALLQLNAVVGVKGVFDENKRITSIGITCALCHSNVDDSFAPGIGRRLDGWPARDLNIGAVINAAPDVSAFENHIGVDEATVRTVLQSWGPGKFDAHLNIDGKAFRPDGETSAVLMPPAYGLAGVNLHTYTGWGGVPHWNAFVSNLEMGGTGRFYDPRMKDAERFPLAAAAGMDNVTPQTDYTTSKLPALQFYQLSLAAPRAPAGSFDIAKAQKGEILFNGKAQCASCHVPPLFTEPGHNLRKPDEIGIDSFHAERSPTGMYRTTPLKGVWSRAKGGYYHDGRFANLGEVIDHYDDFLNLKLTNREKQQLTEYLKSL